MITHNGLELARVVTRSFLESVGTISFLVNAPTVLTAKNSNGKFYTQAAIGDERLFGHGAYIGKKGDVIFIFQAEAGYGFTPDSIEIPYDKAIVCLSGFALYLDTLMNNSEDRDMKEARDKAEFEEGVKHKEAIMISMREDKRFGAW